MELVPVSEAAKILGVSDMTIRRYIQQGKFTAYQYAKDLRIDKDSLLEFIEKSKIVGGNENE